MSSRLDSGPVTSLESDSLCGQGRFGESVENASVVHIPLEKKSCILDQPQYRLILPSQTDVLWSEKEKEPALFKCQQLLRIKANSESAADKA